MRIQVTEEPQEDPRMKLLRGQMMQQGGVVKTPQGNDVALDLIISFRFIVRGTPTGGLLEMGKILTEELNRRNANATRQTQGPTFVG